MVRARGGFSLRRLQWETAKRSATMQIWLGKQYLGQKDKQEQSGPDGGPVREYVVTGVPRSEDGPIGT